MNNRLTNNQSCENAAVLTEENQRMVGGGTSEKAVRIKILRTASTIFFPLVILLILGMSLAYTIRTRSIRHITGMRERDRVVLQGDHIADELSGIAADVIFFSRQGTMGSLFSSDGVKSHARQADLAHEYLSFMQSHTLYDQIRYLDETGQEIVRINFNEGIPEVVSDARLQFKGGRYYFRDAFALEPGQIFVSPLDLNIERGQIEQPVDVNSQKQNPNFGGIWTPVTSGGYAKPMVRVATPVCDDKGNKKGVVLVNYFGARLLQRFDDLAYADQSHSFLLNDQGYWLKSSNADDEWGFMFEDRTDHTFAVRYPQAWSVISTQENGQLRTDQGLFTFTTLYPCVEGQFSDDMSPATSSQSEHHQDAPYFWKIVSLVTNDQLNARSHAQLNWLIGTGILLTVVFAWGSWRLAWLHTQRKQSAMRQAELIEELADANRELNDFAHVISHDLKAPLRGIKSVAEWICDDIKDQSQGDVQENIGLLQGRVDRMRDLIEGVLAYSRAGQAGMDQHPVDTDTVVHEAIHMVSIGDTHDIHTEGTFPTVMGDSTRLGQVFQNLISNAIKYMDKPRGQITVRCQEADHEWVFSVTDNGPGIDARFFDKIFGMFQTLQPRDEYESTGVGLTVVKKVVELHGGRIWVESELGLGSTFSFTITKGAS